MMKVIDDENLGLNVGREEGQDEEDDEDELYRDVNINLEGRGVRMADVYTTQEFKDTHVTLTPVNPDGQQQSSSVSSQFVASMLNPTLDAGIDSFFETTSQMDVSAPTTVASLTFSAPTPTPSTIATISTVPQFARSVASIPGIVQRYMDQRMNKAVKAAVQIQSDRLRDEAQAKNEEFLKNLDENIQKIIKEQVKEQVKVQVSKILLKIEKNVNEQLKAEVLTQSSNSSKTSYVVAADLSEMELKKILIEKMEGNKAIHRSDEQRNLYKALVKAYESDKIIFGNIWRHSVADDQPITEASQHPEWFQQQKKPPTPDRDWNKTLPATHDTLTPELLAGPNYELMKGSCKSLVELEFFLEEVVALSCLITSSTTTSSIYVEVPLVTSTQLLKPRQRQQIMGTSSGLKAWCLAQCGVKNRESARDVYSKRRIIVVTELQIVEWHNYKHLDWITVRRDDDKLYKFKEGDFQRLRIQDIKDMLLLLVQGKLTNLMVEERFAFNVFLRMFTRSIVIQRRVEDLQLGVESYQKKLNLTKPDTYRSDLKRKEAYIAYSNPKGFIYQNKDKQNRFMQIDELHKFSDGTLKGIQMKYMPQTIRRKSDKERATAMI
nr:hypothetical protein [Tanacetum cinerariifolium]